METAKVTVQSPNSLVAITFETAKIRHSDWLFKNYNYGESQGRVQLLTLLLAIAMETFKVVYSH